MLTILIFFVSHFPMKLTTCQNNCFSKKLNFKRPNHKVNLKLSSHQHPLILVDQTQCDDNIRQTSLSINYLLSMCHNPMK